MACNFSVAVSWLRLWTAISLPVLFYRLVINNTEVICYRYRGNRGGFSLAIHHTSLESLGLVSLESIENGRALVAYNEQLCYVENIPWSEIIKTRSHTIRDNMPIDACGRHITSHNSNRQISNQISVQNHKSFLDKKYLNLYVKSQIKSQITAPYHKSFSRTL